ncbi:GNAT family N-acetyltransferase [Paracraurococcus ruber]|uniref:GNAT family N-acetyltransferase n=1 Tax=Paracraurococcus ruber TaxID=77675 RepID=A0ABS1D5L8_9PROT|nr:GNAT family N-acetyltransferase [Paracraurococcus ruber]MBK1662168.1 GNAT family N-acetyltransferase [Paracraurococcus ruber]TDG26909.1 GNAT family N-acetyltransferase [Paracraurococcus ruber]
MQIRPAQDCDATTLADLLNDIIARGGTTALEEPFTPEALARDMLTGPDVICCFVAWHPEGKAAGFQSLLRSGDLPDDVGDIGTFSRVGQVQRGTGSLLFAATRQAATERRMVAINATIRADNAGGLAFYDRLGFVDHDIHRAVPLRDGTPVDRVSKRFVLRTES